MNYLKIMKDRIDSLSNLITELNSSKKNFKFELKYFFFVKIYYLSYIWVLFKSNYLGMLIKHHKRIHNCIPVVGDYITYTRKLHTYTRRIIL